ncbi:MAG: cobalamin biosynthesis protein [Richelia sp.]|nr:cobalamin biosynthesis protein [Richelia sp.]
MTGYSVIFIAAILDYLIGDPVNIHHPVQTIGWVISSFTKLINKYCHHRLSQRLAGLFLGIIVIIGSGAIAQLIIHIAACVHPFLGIAIQIILLASCFAGRSLRNAATAVLQPLEQSNLSVARSILRNYVGRDTENLTTPEILRATLETVTENATDGVMAPLFYAIVGELIPGVEPVTLAMAYKASSTLDSMVGYLYPPYTYLGWFSARLEDRLTWLPCRLHIFTLGIISRKPLEIWRICRRDAIKDPSPNSGWSECSYAAILGVQVGGINWYRGVAKHKPLLGDPTHPITVKSIYHALNLTRSSFLFWLGTIGLFLLLGITQGWIK